MAEIVTFFSGNFISMYFFSCVGALILWMKSTARAKQANSLGDVVDTMFPRAERFAAVLKFMIFVFFGGFWAFFWLLHLIQSKRFRRGSHGADWQ